METMIRLLVRPIEASEIDVTREVIRAANEEFRGTLPDSFFRSYLASAIDVEGRRTAGSVLVAELDGRVVGSITHYNDANDEGMPVVFPPGTAGLRATAVLPEARGVGVGRRLVEACCDLGSTQGSSAIALHTAAFMTSAIVLYVRTGFVRWPQHDYRATDFFRGGPAQDVVATAYLRDLP